jgi:NAD(P)H-hydrate epimerase
MNREFSLTRDQAREIDRIAMEQYGVRGLILMENAGRACTEAAAELLGGVGNPEAFIFCGTGNNGGDGFVVARHLWNRGCDVRACLTGEIEDVLGKGSDASVNLEIARKMGIPVAEVMSEEDVKSVLDAASDADLLVDALLGTGISGEVRGVYAPLIEGINALDAPVLAVDIPSGLDCDTGEVLGVAVRARRTVTFVMKKRGQTVPQARDYVGRLQVAEISVPRQLIERKIQEWGSGEPG